PRQRRAGGPRPGGPDPAAGRGDVGGDGAGPGGSGGGALLRRVRTILAGAAAGPRLRVHGPQPPPTARPGERAVVVRLRDAGEGLFQRGLHGRLRPVQGFLPPEPSWQAVAGVGPDGGVPSGDRRLGRTDADQQRDAGAGLLPGVAGDMPADGIGPAAVLPGVRAAKGDGGDAPGVRLPDELLADAGGAGADAGRVRARLGAGVHGLHGAVMDSYLVCYDISDPKRLRKVATVCEDFGYRRQYSVFLCRLSATDLVRLRSRLYDIIDLSE